MRKLMSALRGIEAALVLHLSWVLVFTVPLRITRRLFGAVEAPNIGVGSAPASEDKTVERAIGVARRLRRVANLLPWHSTCLVRAIAGQMLLTRRGIGGGVIRFGVRKQNGKLEAHAWLLLDNIALLGGEVAEDYLPLADLKLSSLPGDNRPILAPIEPESPSL